LSGRVVLGNVDHGGKFSLYAVPDGNTYDFCDMDAISSNVWHHLAWVFQQTNCMMYIDGVYTSQAPYSVSGLGGRTRIASHNGGIQWYYPGDYAKIKIYPSALSASAVSNLWYNTRYPNNDIETY
jgi:hypothetical protein